MTALRAMHVCIHNMPCVGPITFLGFAAAANSNSSALFLLVTSIICFGVFHAKYLGVHEGKNDGGMCTYVKLTITTITSSSAFRSAAQNRNGRRLGCSSSRAKCGAMNRLIMFLRTYVSLRIIFDDVIVHFIFRSVIRTNKKSAFMSVIIIKSVNGGGYYYYCSSSQASCMISVTKRNFFRSTIFCFNCFKSRSQKLKSKRSDLSYEHLTSCFLSYIKYIIT